VLTSLLGIFIIHLWNIDGGEPAFKYNFNLLWALPLNLVFPFLKGRVRKFYSLAGLTGIGLSLLVHLFRIQDMPLMELWPLWLALLFMFGTAYKKEQYRGHATA
jgi:hypothetical protein